MRGQLHSAVTPSLHAARLISLGRQGDSHRVTCRHHAVTGPAVPSGDNCLIVVSAQPSPELLTATGHALLRAIAAGHSAPLQAAAGALDKLGRLLPDATPEGRLVAVLMALSIEPTSPTVPTDLNVDAVPPPARGGRQGRAGKTGKACRTVRPSRKGKTAALPVMDASGRLQPSKEIGGVAVISQSTARQALGVSCAQMLRLEDQKLLTRIQEPSSRLVHYSTVEVQKLLNLIDRGADSVTDADADATDGVA